MFAKLARHDGLMAAMSRRAGLDLGEALLNGRLNPAEYRGTVVRCIGCRHSEKYSLLLADERETGPVPEYCANRGFFRNLSGVRSKS
ncbi:DUF6455 family protein [Nitratireductor luteus]|uniref:DUF6455 family protein n=1 Tax=Nitratireductor luteus TaxID=2976980 RepID=UPI002240BCD1|nr:DUF6455 family protein [Nitratireductor luteus]